MEKNFKKNKLLIFHCLMFIEDQLDSDYKAGHYYVMPLRAILPVLYRWVVFRFGKMTSSEIEALKSYISVSANDYLNLSTEE